MEPRSAVPVDLVEEAFEKLSSVLLAVADKLRPGYELTLERIEMDAQICREYPCSTEYYLN